MRRIAAGTGIVSGEQAGIAEAVMHRAQIGGACENIVAWIMGIAPQAVRRAHCCPRRWHQLHKAHRARVGSDRSPAKHGLAPAFGAHDPFDPRYRHAEPRGRLGDLHSPAIEWIGSGRGRDEQRDGERERPQRSHSGVALPMTSCASVGPK